MFANITSGLDFHSKALVLRAERQRVIASNIANADTPGYIGRDLNFKDAMEAATSSSSSSLRGDMRGQLSTSASVSVSSTSNDGTAHAQHIALSGLSESGLSGASNLAYTVQTQPNLDGNSVDLDRERANFTDNSVRYEATLRFINAQAKTILSAIQGQ